MIFDSLYITVMQAVKIQGCTEKAILRFGKSRLDALSSECRDIIQLQSRLLG